MNIFEQQLCYLLILKHQKLGNYDDQLKYSQFQKIDKLNLQFALIYICEPLCSSIDSNLFDQSMSRYQQSKKDAFYSMIAQKISQKIDSLAEIPHISQRWIWELIQNTKDADSIFDSIKIKIEIYNDTFIFSHNGNPFTFENLDSLVFHYSTKEDQNKEEIETTGKYGTGFMITYAVSKKVMLMCKFQGNNEANYDDESPNFEGKLSPSIKDKRIVTNKAKNKISKIEEKQFPQSYVQDIKVMLDRNYSSIKQLKTNLQKMDKSVQKQLQSNLKERFYQRTQESFDTCFHYTELDAISFMHIRSAMNSLKQLFPLVLLFNKKLHSISVVNHSTKLSDFHSFTIIREETESFGLFPVFTAQILEKKAKQKNATSAFVKYLYEQNVDTNGIIAFPVEIIDKKLHLLRIPDNYPKIFKEFPLIGCQDLGFNFFFTSKELYPSENRRQLLLKQIQGRKCPKADKNWQILSRLFSQVSEIYILLASKISKGKFNLFILPQNSEILRSSKDLQEKLIKTKNTVFSLQLFPLNSHFKPINYFNIIYNPLMTTENVNKMYNLFMFLYPESLSTENYEEFCSIQSQSSNRLYYQLLEFGCTFINLQECVSKLSKTTFKSITKLIPNQDEALKQLYQIYKFLAKQRNDLLFSELKIILTQSLQFQKFFLTDKICLQIQVSFDQKELYFEIADQIALPYKKFLVHSKFVDLFVEQCQIVKKIKNKTQKQSLMAGMRFEKDEIIQKMQGHLTGIFNANKGGKDFTMLGRYLASFSNTIIRELELATWFQSFKTVKKPLCAKVIQCKHLQSQACFALRLLYSGHFFNQAIEQYYNKSTSITNFAQYFVNKDKAAALRFINQVMENFDFQLDSLPDSSEEIVLLAKTQLKWLQQGYQYLTEADFAIFDRLYQKCNKQFSLTGNQKLLPLNKMLIHPAIVKKKPKSLNIKYNYLINFTTLFNPIKNYYKVNQSILADRQQILNYTFTIYEEYSINDNKMYQAKYETFKEIINERHLQFGKLLNTLNDDQKDFICKIFKMRNKFNDLNSLVSSYKIEQILATMKRANRST